MIRTTYDGPVRIDRLAFGRFEVQLARPADPDRLLNDPAILELNRREDYMPYWAYLWPGAYLLAEAVARETGMVGSNVLEIGCGLGLPGLVAMAAGLDVTFTDYDEAPLRFVEKSLEANGFASGRSSIRRFDWRIPLGERFPLLLGADVLYEKRLVPLVCDVIRSTLEPGGVALVAGPYRVATEDLDHCLSTRGLEATAEAISTSVGASSRGTLHRIRHRSP